MLVSRDGVVKLADFGASKAYRDTTITDCMKVSAGRVLGKKKVTWEGGCWEES